MQSVSHLAYIYLLIFTDANWEIQFFKTLVNIPQSILLGNEKNEEQESTI